MRGKRYRKKQKKSKLFIVILIVFIALVIKNGKQTEEAYIDAENKVADETEAIEEESIVEPTEDEQIKSMIEDLMIEKSLDASNFSFFYYNIEQKNITFIIKIHILQQRVQ